MEWSDLRIFLAIARAGTLGAAARAIGQSQPTMGRRLAALEADVGHKLFQRTKQGLVPTDEGSAMREHAERMEAEAHALDRRLSERIDLLSGELRITSSEWFGATVLTPVHLQATFGVPIEVVRAPDGGLSVRAYSPAQEAAPC